MGKRKWKKRLLAGGMAITMIAALAGCGGKDDGSASNNGSQSEAASGEKIILKFWDMVWGDAEYATEAEKLAKSYTDVNPNVEIEYQSVPWQNRYETFSVAVASGEGPDVSTGGGYQQHQFAASGDILPLNDIVDEWREEGTLDDFPEGMMEFFQDADGNQLGIPFNIDGRSIIYRTDIFEENNIEVPTTWDELYDAVVALSDPDNGQYGLVFAASDSNANVSFCAWLLANGGGVWKEDGVTPDWTSPQNLETLDFIAKMRDAGLFPEGMAAYENTDSRKLFLQGKAAMIVDSVALGSQIAEAGDDLAQNVSLMPFPQGPSSTEPVIATAMNAYMVYSDTEYPEEAKAFVKWWSENNLELWTGKAKCGSPPARLSFLNDPEYLAIDNPLIQPMAEEWVPYMRSTMYPAESANLVQNTVDAEKWWRDVIQAVLIGEKSNQQILEEKQKAAESAIEDIGL